MLEVRKSVQPCFLPSPPCITIPWGTSASSIHHLFDIISHDNLISPALLTCGGCQCPTLWRSIVQNRSYFKNSPSPKADASGLAVAPALIGGAASAGKVGYIHAQSHRVSIDVFTNIFKSNGPTGSGPDGL